MGTAPDLKNPNNYNDYIFIDDAVDLTIQTIHRGDRKIFNIAQEPTLYTKIAIFRV